MTPESLDSAKLADITTKVFWLSLDDRFSDEQRSRLLVIGKKLRGDLLNLITAKFRAGDAALLSANDKLAEVNGMMKKDIADLDDATEVVENLSDLVGILDRLIESAMEFF